MQQKETREERLVQELEEVRERLQQLCEEHALLLRQRDALGAGLGDAEKGEAGRASRETRNGNGNGNENGNRGCKVREL